MYKVDVNQFNKMVASMTPIEREKYTNSLRFTTMFRAESFVSNPLYQEQVFETGSFSAIFDLQEAERLLASKL